MCWWVEDQPSYSSLPVCHQHTQLWTTFHGAVAMTFCSSASIKIFAAIFFGFLILPGCSFKCYHLFSHEAQGRNVPNSLTVGMGFHCSYVPSGTLAMEGSYSDFNQYLRTDKIQNCGNGNWLNLNKRPCWDSIRDPLASEANPWTTGLRYLLVTRDCPLLYRIAGDIFFSLNVSNLRLTICSTWSLVGK